MNELLEWIAMDPDYARHPAARWLHEAQLPIRAFASTVATVIARTITENFLTISKFLRIKPQVSGIDFTVGQANE